MEPDKTSRGGGGGLIHRIVVDLAREHPWLLAANLAMMVFMPVHEVLLPYLFGRVMTSIAQPRWWLALAGVAVALAAVQTGQLLRDWIDMRFQPLMQAFIKVRVMKALLDKHRTSVDAISSGDIVYRLTRLPQIVTQYFTWATDYVIPYAITVASATIYFMRYDLAVGAAFLAYVLLLVYLLRRAPIACQSAARRNDAIYAAVHAKVEDIVQNMGSVYNSDSGGEAELAALTAAMGEYGVEYASSTRCTARYKAAMIPATVALVVVFVARTRALIARGLATQERFVSIFMVLTSILGSMIWFADIIKSVTFDVGAIANLNASVEPERDVAVRERMPGRPPFPDGMGLRNVTYAPAATGRPPVLSGVSMHFEAGAMTALVGPVGVGKSTVFRLLLGFATPQRGDAYVDGSWYSDIGVEAARGRIGYVPQVPVLFDDTVMYNILYGSPAPDAATEREARRLAAFVGLDDDFMDKPVGKGGAHLSGGQRQLVWCLRVLLRNPGVVLLDEPTANMDARARSALLKLLRRHASERGAVVVVITHDPVLMEAADAHVRLQSSTEVVRS